MGIKASTSPSDKGRQTRVEHSFHSVKMQLGFSKLSIECGTNFEKRNSYLTKAKGHWKEEDKLRRIAQVSVDGKVSGLTRSPEELAPAVQVSSLPSLRTADA